MAALFTFLSNILSWLGNLASAFVNFLIGAIGKILTFILELIAWFVDGVSSVVFGSLEFLVDLLPNMPDPPQGLSYVIQVIGAANYILPIQELLTLSLFWGTFYGLLAAYRAVLFLRGSR